MATDIKHIGTINDFMAHLDLGASRSEYVEVIGLADLKYIAKFNDSTMVFGFHMIVYKENYCTDKFNLSPSYFGDLIRHEIGISPMTYI